MSWLMSIIKLHKITQSKVKKSEKAKKVKGQSKKFYKELQGAHLFRMARILGAGGAARAIAHALAERNFTLVIAARWRNSADTASTSARTASDTLRNVASAASAREVAGSNPVVAASSPDASAATRIVPADALDETFPRNISSARS